ncbi:MAG TPA: hypothetical protein VFJ82_11905 [Longimicrobium sp.]|nr:hypothetical protein [Longimicrobium sp.]
MSTRTPTGFYLAGLCSAVFTGVMAWMVVQFGLWTHDGSLRVRAAAALLAVLGAVATEALWGARPWAYRASAALAVAYGASILALAFAQRGMGGVLGACWLLVASAVVVIPIVSYVREVCDDRFGQRRPRPVMTAAYRGRWIRQP